MQKESKELLNTKWLITATIFTGVVLLRTHLPDDRGLLQLQMQVSGFDKVEHKFDEAQIHSHLDEMVRDTVEETINKGRARKRPQ